MSGYYARPVGAKPHSLPAMVIYHGAGVDSANLDQVCGWAGTGFLTLDINAHGLPNGKPREYYDALATGGLKDYRTRGSASRETYYFLGMFLRAQRALDFLTAQPEWDGRTLVANGGSQGGAQAIAAAGLDKRVSFLVAIEPAMCDHTGMVIGRPVGWPKIVLKGADGKPDPATLQAARYFDSVNFAARVKAPAYFGGRFSRCAVSADDDLRGLQQSYDEEGDRQRTAQRPQRRSAAGDAEHLGRGPQARPRTRRRGQGVAGRVRATPPGQRGGPIPHGMLNRSVLRTRYQHSKPSRSGNGRP